MRSYFLYILTNYTNKVFYIGVTNSLERRLLEHNVISSSSFVAKYKTIKLVYFEEYKYMPEAIAREKQLKNWHRQWKINLIKERNAQFQDLSR